MGPFCFGSTICHAIPIAAGTAYIIHEECETAEEQDG